MDRRWRRAGLRSLWTTARQVASMTRGTPSPPRTPAAATPGPGQGTRAQGRPPGPRAPEGSGAVGPVAVDVGHRDSNAELGQVAWRARQSVRTRRRGRSRRRPAAPGSPPASQLCLVGGFRRPTSTKSTGPVSSSTTCSSRSDSSPVFREPTPASARRATYNGLIRFFAAAAGSNPAIAIKTARRWTTMTRANQSMATRRLRLPQPPLPGLVVRRDSHGDQSEQLDTPGRSGRLHRYSDPLRAVIVTRLEMPRAGWWGRGMNQRVTATVSPQSVATHNDGETRAQSNGSIRSCARQESLRCDYAGNLCWGATDCSLPAAAGGTVEA